ncbi:MAG: hypothetical protein WBG71_00205 [Leeuwenhoekiella sp.]
MNRDTLTYLLECPEHLSATHTDALTEILVDHPYFQAARALQLKGLKDRDSFSYNDHLKTTAAHTQDRTVLFDFVTSFGGKKDSLPAKKKTVNELPVNEYVNLSKQVEDEELEKANNILDPEYFQPKDLPPANKEDNETQENAETEESLQLGKPLEFDQQENHSFAEWLKLTSLRPIERKEVTNEGQAKQNTETHTNKSKPTETKKQRKIQLINRFIEKNPRIKISQESKAASKSEAPSPSLPPETLMTETLARVYLEQKNYKKARQAYRILSLKYPDKSGFFADQIRAIEKLQENNN